MLGLESLGKQRHTVRRMQKKLITLKKTLGKNQPDVAPCSQYSVVSSDHHQDPCAFGTWDTGTVTAESRELGTDQTHWEHPPAGGALGRAGARQ